MYRNRVLLSAGALVALVMLALVSGAGSAAAAQKSGTSQADAPAPDQRVQIVGRIEGITARGIRLTTRRGEVLAQVTDRTAIRVQGRDGGCVEGTLRGLQVGQAAMVAGMTTREPGVIAAHLVSQCRPTTDAGQNGGSDAVAPDQPVRIVGRVQRVDDGGLLLLTHRGEVRVRVVEQTEIMVQDDSGECVQGALSGIQTGQRAVVVGRLTDQRGVIVARGIRQCPPQDTAKDN